MEVRLARIEERQKSHGASSDEGFRVLNFKLDAFIAEQGRSNALFWDARNKVLVMQAKHQWGAAAIALVGSITAGTAVALAWLFEQRESILNLIRGKS